MKNHKTHTDFSERFAGGRRHYAMVKVEELRDWIQGWKEEIKCLNGAIKAHEPILRKYQKVYDGEPEALRDFYKKFRG